MSLFKKYRAFRFKEGDLQPVEHPHIPNMEHLLFIDRQRDTILKNTKILVERGWANDVLLWGERGTGKSSLVKALLGVFEPLRIIQIYKMDILHLSDLYTALRNQEESFILFFDDLSFEPNDESFRVLKSFMDGDIEERPKNVAIYATSNRRNLIPQKLEEEKFPEDSAQEVYSLVDRFGIKIGFFGFGKEEYLKMVKNYANLFDVKVEEKELENLALQWALQKGFSGRSALQFIKSLDFVALLRKS